MKILNIYLIFLAVVTDELKYIKDLYYNNFIKNLLICTNTYNFNYLDLYQADGRVYLLNFTLFYDNEIMILYFAFVGSVSETATATSVQMYSEYIQDSASIRSPGSTILGSSLGAPSILSSAHVMKQTSLSGKPFLTSALNTPYVTADVSTQPVLNGSQVIRSTKALNQTSVFVSSIPYTSYLLATTTFRSKENETPNMAATPRVTKTEKLVNPIPISPSTAAKVNGIESTTTQYERDRMKKLLKGTLNLSVIKL